jgi:hypothetical protein
MVFVLSPRVRAQVLGAASPDLLPLGLVALYGAGVETVAGWLGRAGTVSWTLYLTYAVAAMAALCMAALAGLSLQAIRTHADFSLAQGLRLELARRGISGRTFLRSLPLLLALPVFLSLFSSFKSLIPHLHAFSWDPALADLDRLLHGGMDPWRWLGPMLERAPLVRLLDFVYHPVWSLTLFGVWTWQALDRSRPELRLQTLLAIPLAWIVLGSVGGVAFSSAGPCYFAEVGGASERFAPLLAMLGKIDTETALVSQSAQRALWHLYRTGSAGFGSGISAMPSVHVASAWLLVLLAARLGPVPLAAAALLFATVCVGSVALGWHYAVDSYAGAALASPIWIVCGAIAKRAARPSQMH